MVRIALSSSTVLQVRLTTVARTELLVVSLEPPFAHLASTACCSAVSERW